MKNIFLNIFLILSIGCFNKSVSQDFWQQLYFPDSADIMSIAVDEQEIIFIGTNIGIYRSSDNGNTWDFVFDESRSVRSVTINTDGNIYAGSRKSIYNEGLFRSADNGDTWDTIHIDLDVYGNIISVLPFSDTIYVSLLADGATIVRSIDNGETWDLVFFLENSSDYVKDIVRSNAGHIHICLTGYSPNAGGVYKSTDGGDAWEFIGLFNYMVMALAFNSSDDLFAGSWGTLGDTASSGLYVLRAGENEWDELLEGPAIYDIVVNSDEHIYSCGSWPNGVVRSIDNGENFELINDGLPEGIMRNLFIDTYDFIYVINLTTLAKSINPTVSVIEKFPVPSFNNWLIYPNPFSGNTAIHYSLKNQANVLIKVIDHLGKEVKRLNLQNQENGSHHYVLNMSGIPSGIYFCSVYVNGYLSDTKKMVLK